MKSVLLPYQKAARNAIVTAMTGTYSTPATRVVTNPRNTTPVPYIQLGGATITPDHTKDLDGSEMTYLFVVWGVDATETASLADVALQAVTDRDAPLTFDAPFRALTRGTVDVWEEPTEVQIGETIRWRLAFRTRLIVDEGQ